MGGRIKSAFGAALVLAMLALWAASSTARTPPRLALVIANQNYAAEVGPLENPHADAALVADALRLHGFEVEIRRDLSAEDLRFEVEAFAQRVAAAGAGAESFLYYAGHGAAHPQTGVNYLIPISVPTLSDGRVWSRSVGLDDLRRTLSDLAPDAQHIVVFDACRNELAPIPGLRGRRGFEAPQEIGGMLTAFSAAAGQFASDGAAGANGPYAVALAETLRAADGVLAETLFARVRFAVRRAAPGQDPLFEPALNREVIFSVAAPPRIETTTSPLDGATVFLTGETSELEPLSVFRECDVCPEMVTLPGGAFTMGSPESEEGRRSDEGPQQEVTIQPFAMGRTEVTFAMWDACAADGFCRAGTNDNGWGRDQRPVITVSWNDITGEGVSERGFLAWLNSRPGVSGAPYRLPSEAEWEYAARGGAQSAYSFGESAAQLGQYGWHRANSEGRTQPVGRLRPNAFGLYDVHGNVWEWVQDCWTASLDASLRTAQARMTGDCSRAVLRGGSWDNSPVGLRSAYRIGVRRNFRFGRFGFRLARTLLE